MRHSANTRRDFTRSNPTMMPVLNI
jgi:hypothetical protein